MRIKDSGNLRIECDFANRQETVSINYRRMDDSYFYMSLSASQAGCSMKAPFICTDDSFSTFLTTLREYNHSLQMPTEPVALLDFTCQNGIVAGPLIPHQGILFLDITIGYAGTPLEGLTCEVDCFEEKYKRVRRGISAYPSLPTLSHFSLNDNDDLSIQELDQILKDPRKFDSHLKEIQRKTQATRATLGTRIEFCGLHFHRNQIDYFVDEQFE